MRARPLLVVNPAGASGGRLALCRAKPAFSSRSVPVVFAPAVCALVLFGALIFPSAFSVLDVPLSTLVGLVPFGGFRANRVHVSRSLFRIFRSPVFSVHGCVLAFVQQFEVVDGVVAPVMVFVVHVVPCGNRPVVVLPDVPVHVRTPVGTVGFVVPRGLSVEPNAVELLDGVF